MAVQSRKAEQSRDPIREHRTDWLLAQVAHELGDSPIGYTKWYLAKAFNGGVVCGAEPYTGLEIAFHLEHQALVGVDGCRCVAWDGIWVTVCGSSPALFGAFERALLVPVNAPIDGRFARLSIEVTIQPESFAEFERIAAEESEAIAALGLPVTRLAKTWYDIDGYRIGYLIQDVILPQRRAWIDIVPVLQQLGLDPTDLDDAWGWGVRSKAAPDSTVSVKAISRRF